MADLIGKSELGEPFLTFYLFNFLTLMVCAISVNDAALME
jgi:hypothetical protein